MIRALSSKANGFTLMEVMVAIAITGITMTMATPIFIMQAKQNLTSEQKTAAIEATQRVIDDFRLQIPSSLPTTGYTSQTITVNGKPYVVRTAYCTTSSRCSSVTRQLYLSTTLNNVQLYATETVFTQLR